MRLNNRTYDLLKWITLICLPALQVFWLSISEIWHLNYGAEIGATIGAVALLLGSLLQISNYQHNKPFQIDIDSYLDDEEIEPTEVEEEVE